jgi:hypothetical protein
MVCILSWLFYVLTPNIPPTSVSCGLFTLKFAELWTRNNLTVSITDVNFLCVIT